MVWSAGQRVTANRLAARSSMVSLTNTALTASYSQWGSETVTFPNPGMACTVKMWLSGYFDNSTESSAVSYYRISYSTDGGATFTASDSASVRHGTTYGDRISIGRLAFFSGTPTGSVVVKAEQHGSSASTATSGQLMAELVPNP